MDFDRGGGAGRPDDRPLYGGEAGGPARGPAPGPAGSPGGEFNLQDPINSFIGTVRGVVLDPVGFFRGIARQGDFVNPLLFALICAAINGLLSGIINFLSLVRESAFGVGGALAGLISSIVLTPILTAIGLFVGAAVTFALVLLLVKPNAGFEATLKVASYVSAVQLVSWLSAIPYLGVLISMIILVYTVFLAVVGIREVHVTTTGKALAVVLIPVAVLLFLMLLLGILIGAALFLGGQQQF